MSHAEQMEHLADLAEEKAAKIRPLATSMDHQITLEKLEVEKATYLKCAKIVEPERKSA